VVRRPGVYKVGEAAAKTFVLRESLGSQLYFSFCPLSPSEVKTIPDQNHN